MKKIERSFIEAIEFFDTIDWSICYYTKKMIKDSDEIKDFYHCYKENHKKEKLDKIVNFFWEKEYELRTFGRFWDNQCGLEHYGFLVKIENSKFYKGFKNNPKNDYSCWFNHFEPLTEIPKYEGEK